MPQVTQAITRDLGPLLQYRGDFTLLCVGLWGEAWCPVVLHCWFTPVEGRPHIYLAVRERCLVKVTRDLHVPNSMTMAQSWFICKGRS